MDPLEALAAQIQGLSSSPEDIARLHTILKQADDSLRAESTQLSPLLTQQLNPSHHSLGFLYVLEAFTSSPISKEQAETVISVITGFINACIAEQIRLAPEKFILVCKRLKEIVMLVEAPIRGVAPLLTAVRKLQVSIEYLTPLHSEFLLLCLLAKCYKTGLSLLEDDVFEIEQPRDLFLYCYYGGMICIGQKRFHKALDLLRNWQLSISLPKYTSSVAQRNLQNFCQPYMELANCYGSAKVAELEAYVNTNTEKFENDNNLGLVKQVVSSLYKRNIQRLTQTFLTLSLQDIASSVQLNSSKEAEMHVLRMIQDGEIYATINQRDGMVRFLEDPEQYKRCEMIQHIDSSIQRIMALSRKLTAMDEQISCDQFYLSKAGKERQRIDFDDLDVPSRFNI